MPATLRTEILAPIYESSQARSWMPMGGEGIPYNYTAGALSPVFEKSYIIAPLRLQLFIMTEKNPYSEKIVSFDSM